MITEALPAKQAAPLIFFILLFVQGSPLLRRIINEIQNKKQEESL